MEAVARAGAAPQCRRCRSRDLLADLKTGDVVCRGCGEIQRDRIIDSSDEVRKFGEDDSTRKRESRTSGLSDGGLRPVSTVFVSGSSRTQSAYCSSLNRSTELAEGAEDKMAAILASHIEKMCSSLNLSRHILVRLYGTNQTGEFQFFQSRDGKNARRKM